MEEEAVEPQAEMDHMIEQAQPNLEHEEAPEQEVNVDHEEEAYKKTMIPLSVAQKLRMKNKELELENQWMKQQQQAAAAPPVEDESRYESATKQDLSKSQEEAIRVIEERLWIKQNPEKIGRAHV